MPEAHEVSTETLARTDEATRRPAEQDPEAVRSFVDGATIASPVVRTAGRAAVVHAPGSVVPGDDLPARAVATWREARAVTPGFDPTAEVRLERKGELGRGGMGVVYLVRDEDLGREAALKLVLGDGDGDAGGVERFVREVRITARLEHPSIPPVYAAGATSRGERYLLMKRIEGEPLSKRLKAHDWKRRVDDAELGWIHEQLEVLVKIGQAVDYAHGRRILHRDLKPANVMVGKFGEVLVMDWGLAKDLTANESDDVLLRGSRSVVEPEGEGGLTQAGSTLGTPGYMSPEQAGGTAVDERSDVFALGAMLVAVLTGRPPFEADGSMQLVAASIKCRVVLPRKRRHDLPRELDSIAARALAKGPEVNKRTVLSDPDATMRG